MGLNVRKKVTKDEFNSYWNTIKDKVCFDKLKEQTLSFANGQFTMQVCTSCDRLLDFIHKEFFFVLHNPLSEHDCYLIADNYDIHNFKRPEAYKDAGKIEFICDDVGVIAIDYENDVLIAFQDEIKQSVLLTKDLSDIGFILRQGHLFVQIVNHWARMSELILLHCAAVAQDGSGTLICGRGGRGKSTLAITSLVNGFDYISDDYLLCKKSADNELEVFPIYSIITLSDDIHSKLIGFDGDYIGISPWTGKNVYAIGGYDKAVLPSLKVKRVIFPHVCFASVPVIKPCGKQQPLSHIVTSTLSQLYGEVSITQIPVLMNVLSGLKYYQFDLTGDLFANSNYLRKFLQASSN